MNLAHSSAVHVADLSTAAHSPLSNKVTGERSFAKSMDDLDVDELDQASVGMSHEVTGPDLFSIERRDPFASVTPTVRAGADAVHDRSLTNSDNGDPDMVPSKRAPPKGTVQLPDATETVSALIDMTIGGAGFKMHRLTRNRDPSASRVRGATKRLSAMRAQQRSDYIHARAKQTLPPSVRPGLGADVEEILEISAIASATTTKGGELQKTSAEISRCLNIISDKMARRILDFSEDEMVALSADSGAALAKHIVKILSKHSASTMQQGRLALLALHDFALQAGLELVDFACSRGFLSAFFSSISAPTMPAKRRAGLIWAQHVLKIEIQADDDMLQVYARVRGTGQGHAITMPLILSIHFPLIACDPAYSMYVRNGAAINTLMGNGSLRWIDIQRSTDVRMVTRNGLKAPQGVCQKTKSGNIMHWWAEAGTLINDNSKWFNAVEGPLKELDNPDFVARKALFEPGHAGDPDYFTGWGEGPAVKKHFVLLFIYICGLPPLRMPAEVARKFARLHGWRRVFPLLARLLSGELKLRLEDREELGRWLSSLATSNDSHRTRRPLSNLYGSDAARTNCVRTRKRIADAVRDKLLAAADGTGQILIYSLT